VGEKIAKGVRGAGIKPCGPRHDQLASGGIRGVRGKEVIEREYLTNQLPNIGGQDGTIKENGGGLGRFPGTPLRVEIDWKKDRHGGWEKNSQRHRQWL